MKANPILLFILFLLVACQPKDVEPSLDFTVKVDDYKVSVSPTGIDFEKYDVNFGIENTNFGSIQTPEYKYEYAEDGTFSITVTATDKENRTYTKTKTVKIDYYAKNNLLANFSITKIGQAKYQVTNLTNEQLVIGYAVLIKGNQRAKMYYFTKEKNPILHLDLNATYTITQQTNSLNTKSISVKVEDAEVRENGYLKLKIDNEEITTNESEATPFGAVSIYNIPPNYQILNAGVFPYKLSNITLVIENTLSIDQQPSADELYKLVASSATIGKKEKGSWNISLTDDSIEPFIEISSQSIEVLKVEPVEQKKIIPEMNEKAFWVTAKINLTCNYQAFKNVSGEVRFKYRIITL